MSKPNATKYAVVKVCPSTGFSYTVKVYVSRDAAERAADRLRCRPNGSRMIVSVRVVH